MKQFFAILFLLISGFAASTQNYTDTSRPLIFFPTPNLKAAIYLKDHTVITGVIKNITDSFVLVSSSLKNRTDSLDYDSISISEIQTIKIKRHALWLGMGCGTFAGGLAGYGLGYITYSYDASISDDDNKDDQHARGIGGAVILAVPGAVVGGIIGAIGSKRKFIINGDKNKLRQMIQTLWEYH